MAEDTTGQVPTTTPAPDAGSDPAVAQAATGQPATTPHDVSQLPEWARNMIGDLRKENAGHRKAKTEAEKAAEAAAQAAAAEQGRFKELYEAAEQKRQAAEAKARQLELDALKAKVGAAVGLPAGLAARLTGETEDELTADAKSVLALLPKQPPMPNDAQAGTGNGPVVTDPATRRVELEQRYRI